MSTALNERGQVTVRLDGPTWARLEREALQDRRPVASLARLLIVDALADREAGADRERQGARVQENDMPMPFSPAGQALFGQGQIPGLTSVSGLGDSLESPEERKRRLQQLQQSRGQLTQQGSPATQSLFGGIGGYNGTGLLR